MYAPDIVLAPFILGLDKSLEQATHAQIANDRHREGFSLGSVGNQKVQGLGIFQAFWSRHSVFSV
jgi:hypothetical protein